MENKEISDELNNELCKTIESIVRSYPFFANTDKKILDFAEKYHQSKYHK